MDILSKEYNCNKDNGLTINYIVKNIYEILKQDIQMFIRKSIKIPLFVMISLLSLALIFLASCKDTTSDDLEESVQSDVVEEETMEKVEDATIEKEMIKEDIEDDVEPIDSKSSEDFTDLKGIKEVTINMTLPQSLVQFLS